MDRFLQIVNLRQFDKVNRPIPMAAPIDASPGVETQMILRMLVETPSHGVRLPKELEWLSTALESAKTFQREHIGVRHPYTYVTVRHGFVDTHLDDEWHVDGFSTKITHLPEANYVFATGEHPTEWVEQSFPFPKDFDPLVHNVHKFFQHRVNPSCVRRMIPGVLTFMDPYVIHRRPPATRGQYRTFVRISFTPIEIPDINNTPNPLIPTPHYITDGLVFRSQLVDYDQAA